MKFKVDNYRYTPNTIEEIANNYAFMYSKSFSLIEKKSKRKLTEKQKLEGYLKVTSKSGKSVYLKYLGWNGVKEDEIWLTYYNKCTLGVKIGDEVEVQPSNTWSYYLNTWDSGIRLPFKIAIWGVIISSVLSIISIILTLIS